MSLWDKHDPVLPLPPTSALMKQASQKSLFAFPHQLLFAHMQDNTGVLEKEEGLALLQQALTIQETIKMKRELKHLQNLRQALDEYGHCSSESMCCGPLIFTDQPKLRRAIEAVRAHQELRECKCADQMTSEIWTSLLQM